MSLMQRWAEDLQGVTEAANEVGRRESSAARVAGLLLLVPLILGASRRYAGPRQAARHLGLLAVAEYRFARRV